MKKNKEKKGKVEVWYDGLDDRCYKIYRNEQLVATHFSDGSVKFYPGATFWDKIRIYFL